MSKEVIRSTQFAHVKNAVKQEPVELSQEQLQELALLYEGTLQQFKPNTLIMGTVVSATASFVVE